jgi:hypothetical protein
LARASVILRGRHVRSSEGNREGVVHMPRSVDRQAIRSKEKRAMTGSAQVIHTPSTGFPQPRLGEVVDPRLAFDM